jgi:broad specificity phosphatase PhoE
VRDESGVTKFLLCRHGAHVLGGDVIAGAAEEAVLSGLGRTQTSELADRVSRLPVNALYTSPVARARQTAEGVGERLRVRVQASEALREIGFGAWEGKRLDELRGLPVWKQWNAFRSGTRAPGGETMLEVQARVVGEMARLAERHPGQTVALVSHGDVIKAAVAYYLGAPLDLFQRIEISLASVSVVAIGEYGPWVLCVNSTGMIPVE